MQKTSQLKRLREARALSQEDLGELAKVSRATITDLESGRRPARPSTRRKLAAALGVEVGDLLEPENPKAQASRGAGRQSGKKKVDVVSFLRAVEDVAQRSHARWQERVGGRLAGESDAPIEAGAVQELGDQLADLSEALEERGLMPLLEPEKELDPAEREARRRLQSALVNLRVVLGGARQVITEETRTANDPVQKLDSKLVERTKASRAREEPDARASNPGA